MSKIIIGADTSGAQSGIKKLEQQLGKLGKIKESVASRGGDMTKREAEELERISNSFQKSYSDYLGGMTAQANALKKELGRLREEMKKSGSEATKTAYSQEMRKLEAEKKRIESDIAKAGRLNRQERVERKPLQESYQRKQEERAAKRGKGNKPSGKPSSGSSDGDGKGDGKGGGKGGKDGKWKSALNIFRAFAQGKGVGGALGTAATGALKGAGGAFAKLASPIGIGMVVAGLLQQAISRMTSKYGDPAMERDRKSYETWQSTGHYGSDFVEAKNEAIETGAKYGFKGDIVEDVTKSVVDTKGSTSKDKTLQDVESILKFSRATGVQASMVGQDFSKISQKSGVEISDISDVVLKATKELGMEGRDEEVIQQLQRLVDLGVENNVKMDKSKMENYMAMAKSLQDEKGYDSNKALDETISTAKAIQSNGNINSLYLSGAGDMEDYNQRKREIESGDPVVIQNMARKLIEQYGEDDARNLLQGQMTQQQIDNVLVVAKSETRGLEGTNKLQSGLHDYLESDLGKDDKYKVGKDNLAQKTGNVVNKFNKVWKTPLSWIMNSGLDTDLDEEDKLPEKSKVPEDEKRLEKAPKKSRSFDASMANPITKPKDGKHASITRDNEGLTAEEINKIIELNVKKAEKTSGRTSLLRGQGETFLKASKESGINALDLLAIAMHESEGGTSNIAYKKNNFFGYGANDANPMGDAYKFGSPGEGIQRVSNMIGNGYVKKRKQDSFHGIISGVDKDGRNTGYKYARDAEWGNKTTAWRNKLVDTANEVRSSDSGASKTLNVVFSGKIEGVTPQTEQYMQNAFKSKLDRTQILQNNIVRGN